MESMYEQSRYYRDEKMDPHVEVSDVSSIRSGSDSAQVVGSADMFDENGNIRLIPVRLPQVPGLIFVGPRLSC